MLSKDGQDSVKYFSIVCDAVEESKDTYSAARFMIMCLWDVTPCSLVHVS